MQIVREKRRSQKKLILESDKKKLLRKEDTANSDYIGNGTKVLEGKMFELSWEILSLQKIKYKIQNMLKVIVIIE